MNHVLVSILVLVCVAAAFFIKRKSARPTVSDVIDVDTSGFVDQLGGTLLDNIHVAHVTHWPTKVGQKVRLDGKDGKATYRRIKAIKTIRNDLSVLTLDRPVDLGNHTVLPIADPQKDSPITIFRLRREPFGTYSKGAHEGWSYSRADGRLESGDSGKAHVQLVNGEPHVVSLSTKESGKGPHLALLLREWRSDYPLTIPSSM